ncbi:MAG TPA: hypothetical protein VG370_05660 [Chloroflexota bacterium]|nr:hypothetical protein [Chloroflexota bacterium]
MVGALTWALVAGLATAAAAQEIAISKTDLYAVAGSGLFGVAVLEATGQRTRISVALVGAPAGAAFSASVRVGTCTAPGPVVFALGVTARAPDGADRLVATVDARLASGLDSPHLVGVDTPSGQTVACGELALTAAARQQRAALAGADARTALTRFTEARFERRLSAALELLTAEARLAVIAPGGGVFELVPTSNPCWYRYAVEAFAQPTPATAAGRVRIYEHTWMGDVGGSLPRSWQQAVGLVQTPDGWRVSRLGQAGPRRDEPGEPHGPTTSACNVGRRVPVWLESSRLPASGGLPAATVPLAAAAGLALLGAGLAARRLHRSGTGC